MLVRKRVDQCRLADTRGTEQRDRLATFAPRAQSLDLSRVARIQRLDEDPRRQRAGLRQIGVDIFGQVGLGDNNHRKGAGIVRDRHIALQPGNVEVAICRGDDEQRIDVRRNQLDFAGDSGSASLKQRLAFEALADRGSRGVEQDPVPDRDSEPSRLSRHRDGLCTAFVGNLDSTTMHVHNAARQKRAVRINL